MSIGFQDVNATSPDRLFLFIIAKPNSFLCFCRLVDEQECTGHHVQPFFYYFYWAGHGGDVYIIRAIISVPRAVTAHTSTFQPFSLPCELINGQELSIAWKEQWHRCWAVTSSYVRAGKKDRRMCAREKVTTCTIIPSRV